MANAPTRAELAANIRRQLAEITAYRRDHVDLRPVEWDMVCEALAEQVAATCTHGATRKQGGIERCLWCGQERVYSGAQFMAEQNPADVLAQLATDAGFVVDPERLEEARRYCAQPVTCWACNGTRRVPDYDCSETGGRFVPCFECC
jgi:hypothetical protein